jgi:hypothetical protein
VLFDGYNGDLMSENRFNFDEESGNLSLDIANTKDWHASDHPVELLNTYDDVIFWGEEAGLLSGSEADQLRRNADENPSQANADYDQTINLRDIYHIFLTSTWDAKSQRMTGDAEHYRPGGYSPAINTHDSLRWDWIKGRYIGGSCGPSPGLLLSC